MNGKPYANNRLQTIYALVSLIALIAFLGLLMMVSKNLLASTDSSIMLAVYASRTEQLTNIMKIITFLGGDFLIILSAGISLIPLFKKHWLQLIVFVTASVGGEILNTIIKDIIARPRPGISQLVSETGFSFPSSHSMGSTVVFLILVIGIWQYTKNQRLTLISLLVAIVLILLIGLSRIYLGVHFPSDVLGGYFAGICWLSTVLWLGNYFRAFERS
jgi:undecaprenyl-diphosphatase